MGMKRTGEWDPDFGRVPDRPGAARARRRRLHGVELPRRSPDVGADNEVFRPPFLGSRVVKGIGLDEIAEYVNETALYRNQWQFRPEKDETGRPESDDEFKARIRADRSASSSASAKASGVLVPQVVYGYFAANGDGNDLVVWTDESRTTEAARFPFPRQKVGAVPVHRRLLPADRLGRASTTRRSTSSRWAPPSARRRRSCSPTTSTSSTCCCTGSASRWPRHSPSLAPPHPRGVGVRGRGRPDDRWAVPPAVPRRAVLVGLSRLPGPRGQRHGGPAARRRAPGHRGQRGDRLAVPTGADDLRDHLPPPPGQVLRRPLAILTTVGSAERYQLSTESDQASRATASNAPVIVSSAESAGERGDTTRRLTPSSRERLRPLRCQPATGRHRDLQRSEVGRSRRPHRRRPAGHRGTRPSARASTHSHTNRDHGGPPGGTPVRCGLR